MWKDIIKKKKLGRDRPRDATHLAIIYFEDELLNEYDGAFAGKGFRRHAHQLIADGMRAGKSDEEIKQILYEEIPKRTSNDREFRRMLTIGGKRFKDINFKEVVDDALTREIKYLSHIRNLKDE